MTSLQSGPAPGTVCHGKAACQETATEGTSGPSGAERQGPSTPRPSGCSGPKAVGNDPTSAQHMPTYPSTACMAVWEVEVDHPAASRLTSTKVLWLRLLLSYGPWRIESPRRIITIPLLDTRAGPETKIFHDSPESFSRLKMDVDPGNTNCAQKGDLLLPYDHEDDEETPLSKISVIIPMAKLTTSADIFSPV